MEHYSPFIILTIFLAVGFFTTITISFLPLASSEQSNTVPF